MTPSTLYALTPVDQVEGLEDGWYTCIDPNYKNQQIILRYSSYNDTWVDWNGDSFHPSFYLRPLPPGTVTIDKDLIEKEPVNFILANALRFCSPEQLISLRDALIERTPKDGTVAVSEEELHELLDQAREVDLGMYYWIHVYNGSQVIGSFYTQSTGRDLTQEVNQKYGVGKWTRIISE